MTTTAPHFPKEEFEQRLERLRTEMRKRKLDLVLVGVVDAVSRNGIIASGLRATSDNITCYTLGFYSQQAIKSSDFTRTFTRTPTGSSKRTWSSTCALGRVTSPSVNRCSLTGKAHAASPSRRAYSLKRRPVLKRFELSANRRLSSTVGRYMARDESASSECQVCPVPVE